MPVAKSSDQQRNVTLSYSDSHNFCADDLRWTDQGMVLVTKWPFRTCAEIELGVQIKRRRHHCTAIVVACQEKPRQPGIYDTTVYFIEAPCAELQAFAKGLGVTEEAPPRRVRKNELAVLNGHGPAPTTPRERLTRKKPAPVAKRSGVTSAPTHLRVVRGGR